MQEGRRRNLCAHPSVRTSRVCRNPKSDNDYLVLLLLLYSCQIHIPSTMRLCNSRIPEECLMCYQTSQRNRVIIKMLYRYLRRCLLSWHRSRLGFVTPSIGEVSLGPLGNTHYKFARKQLRSWSRDDVLWNE